MKDIYVNPLSERYSSKEMQKLFSPDKKFSCWRKLWVILAESEKELGVEITDEQIAEMKAHVYDIDYDKAKTYENEIRHDVMAHIKAYGDVCPKAKGIIHLGATSCFVGDNTDIIIYKEALELIENRLIALLSMFYDFCLKHKNERTLAYTHFQAAQPTTLGKRATLWAQDLTFDLERLREVKNSLKLLGCKGTTGTAASFLKLLKTKEKVVKLEQLIAEKVGLKSCYDVSGQTYSRKIDYFILSVLSGIAQSASKFANDIRLLSHLKEVEEPFEESQVGSSAMAYKRNPMRSERICSLSRLVICEALNPAITASAQWLERTLDDSANRRVSIPEAFLATDGLLGLYGNVLQGLKTYPIMMKKHLDEELPFMITENIMTYLTARGYDRQKIHEAIRNLSVETAENIKNEGAENDLVDKILKDERFDITREEINEIIDSDELTGIAVMQTEAFCQNVLKPLIKEKIKPVDFSVNV